MKIRFLSTLAAICTLFVAGASAQTSTAVVYRYTAISYPGTVAQETSVNGINNSNVIVGSYPDPTTGVGHAFEYINGKYTTFDFPGASGTFAMGINDYGDVVGSYTLPNSSNSHGFLRHNGAFTTIDYPGASDTALVGINNAGTIVGNEDSNNGFIYKNGTFTLYSAPTRGTLPNYFSTLFGINNPGQFVGEEQSGDYLQGFWVTGNDADFLEPNTYFANNNVTGINGRGDIVGCLNSGPYVAFAGESSESSESTEKFPTLQMLSNPLASQSCPSGINYSRVIVGNPGFMAAPILTLNVTSPANHVKVSNPVHVVANASGVNPISQMQVWANFKEVYHVSGGSLNTYLNLPAGSNERFVVQAIDSKGVIAKVVESITVN